MLKSRVSRQNGVIRFDDGARELGGRVYAELQLGLLSIVGREPFQQKRTEARSSATTEGMEHEETLQTRAVVGETTQFVHDGVNEFLSYGVVATGVCEETAIEER